MTGRVFSVGLILALMGQQEPVNDSQYQHEGYLMI
jgi:hypothetical protein